MHIPVAVLLPDIMDHYQLYALVHNGHVHVEIRWVMYGLPQAGKIALDQLQKFLLPHGYHPCPFTPGLWQHDTHDIQFTLVVNDFSICYTSQDVGQPPPQCPPGPLSSHCRLGSHLVLWSYPPMGLFPVYC